jgi:molybdopterin molybdotransferase
MITLIMQLPLIDQVTSAMDRLSDSLRTVDLEPLSLDRVAGRVLAEPLSADRDSPPLDVSAMDGYALRLTDATKKLIPIVAVVAAGSSRVNLPVASAVRIFTGGPVPSEAELVVKREDTIEAGGAVSINLPSEQIQLGMNIRRKGENGNRGDLLLDAGTLLNPSRMAVVATFGPVELRVFRKVRVAILNTGDELIPPGAPADPWQIRDSNGPVLESMLRNESWINVVSRKSVADDLASIEKELSESLTIADAVLLTGGVSMGDYDYVPQAIEACGGRIVFHRLPIRPGKPILGAVGLSGQLICGLPGNPVSVAVTARRFAMPLIRGLAGMNKREDAARRFVNLSNPDSRKLDLLWYRLVRLCDDGTAELLDSKGSGDLISLAQSDGFVEVEAGHSGAGPWLMRTWC